MQRKEPTRHKSQKGHKHNEEKEEVIAVAAPLSMCSLPTIKLRNYCNHRTPASKNYHLSSSISSAISTETSTWSNETSPQEHSIMMTSIPRKVCNLHFIYKKRKEKFDTRKKAI